MAAAIAVAEREPLLAGIPFACPADIGATVAPSRVHVVQPERRRPGANGNIDEEVWVLPAQGLCDFKQCHEMRADAIAGPVPFEDVNASLAHELQEIGR